MKKLLLAIISSLFILNIVSCDAIKSTEPNSLFDIEDAKSLAGKYMESLSRGDVESVNGLSNDKFILGEQAKKLQENKVISFKVDQVTEGSNFVYIKYLVVRNRDDSIKTTLDNIELKVIKDGDKYFVNDVSTKGIKEVYEEGTNLRVIDEKVGKSNLLLRKKDLPQEVYPKLRDEAVITRESVPNMNFKKVDISFNGVNVALCLENEKDVFIGIAQIDESKNSSSSSKEGGEDYIAIGDNLENALEKPVAKNIAGYDLLKDAHIQKLLFTDDDGNLIAQLVGKGGVSFIRIYKNPTGELLKLDLEEIFPKDQYSLDIEKITSEGVYINSKAISDVKENEGVYIVDCKNMKLSKDKES
ncbi:MAG: hypothetical protein E7214_15365 [Clostridium sp.]|nr:hypothetical protein [Clostridium sp.]